MENRPTQFTIRAIAFATFWMGACFAALGLAKSGVVPIAFFVLGVISLCGAVYAMFKDAPTGSPGSWKAFVAALVVWNVPIFPLMLAYPYTVGELLMVMYVALFGDIQTSYGAFERIAMFVGYASVTLPATLIAVWLFDKLVHRTWRWRRSLLTIAVWEVLVVFVLVSSYEIGFPYALHQVEWAVFGPTDDVYSFQNLALHRIIAWLIETTPVAWIALWAHTKLARAEA
jgi:hypothetical protein